MIPSLQSASVCVIFATFTGGEGSLFVQERSDWQQTAVQRSDSVVAAPCLSKSEAIGNKQQSSGAIA